MTERDPTQSEIDQREIEDLRAVPVAVQGPVKVQALPSRLWAPSSVEMDTTPQRVLNADGRRSVAYLVGDAPFVVGSNDADCRASRAPWPASTPLPLTHAEEVWAAADTGTVNLFISAESWTE